jgi:hypothetical protein
MGAAGYFANALVIGEADAARADILRRAPASTRQWFVDHEKKLREAALSGPSKLSVSQAKVLEPREP